MRPELGERPIIYGICHLRRREGAGGMSRPVALPRPAGRGANWTTATASNGIQVDQGVARKAKQKPEGEMEGTKTAAASEAF